MKTVRAISTVQYVIITVVAILLAVGVAAWMMTQQQAYMQQAQAVRLYAGLAYIGISGNNIYAFACLENPGTSPVDLVGIVVTGYSIKSGPGKIDSNLRINPGDKTIDAGERYPAGVQLQGTKPTIGAAIQGTISLSNGQTMPIVFRVVDANTLKAAIQSCK